MKSDEPSFGEVQSLFPEYELRDFIFERGYYSAYHGEVINTFRGIFLVGSDSVAFAFQFTDEELPRVKKETLLKRIEKGMKDYLSLEKNIDDVTPRPLALLHQEATPREGEDGIQG